MASHISWFEHLFVTEQGAAEADMAVMFHREDHPQEEARVLSLMEAAALGYHISVRGSHLTLRCSYSSPLSYFVKVLRDNIVYWGLGLHIQFKILALSVSAFFSGCCVWVFFPGEGSGFRDCQSNHPVPNPELLPHCWHHCCLCSELVYGLSVLHLLCTTVKYQSEMSPCSVPFLTPRWGYSRWVWPALDCPLYSVSVSPWSVQGQRHEDGSERPGSKWVWK